MGVMAEANNPSKGGVAGTWKILSTASPNDLNFFFLRVLHLVNE